MIRDLRLIARIALFSALVYAVSLAFSAIPNVNAMFFVVFLSGLLWGARAGMLVGAIGMGLWTLFNPYGPASWPVMLAQVAGAASNGIVGATLGRRLVGKRGKGYKMAVLLVSAVACTIAYFLPVNLMDAWVFQPFWPRFISSSVGTLVTLGANVVFFPLLFPVVQRLYDRERGHP